MHMYFCMYVCMSIYIYMYIYWGVGVSARAVPGLKGNKQAMALPRQHRSPSSDTTSTLVEDI